MREIPRIPSRYHESGSFDEYGSVLALRIGYFAYAVSYECNDGPRDGCEDGDGADVHEQLSHTTDGDAAMTSIRFGEQRVRIRIIPGRQCAIETIGAAAEVGEFDERMCKEENGYGVRGSLVGVVRFAERPYYHEDELRENQHRYYPRIDFTYETHQRAVILVVLRYE